MIRRGGGAFQRVDQDQQFHEVVVGGKRRRLDDEDILAADVFLDLDEDFHVCEALADAFGHGHVEMGADGFGQGAVAVSGNEFKAQWRLVAMR